MVNLSRSMKTLIILTLAIDGFFEREIVVQGIAVDNHATVGPIRNQKINDLTHAATTCHHTRYPVLEQHC